MNLLFNGAVRNQPLITFTDVHNIIQVKENVSGTKASLKLCVQGNWKASVSAESQYYFTIFGETITNTMSPSLATNKKFYIAEDKGDTAISIARALRNCSSLSAQYIISTGTTNIKGDTVIITSKTIGYKNFAKSIDRNIPSTYLLVGTVSNGSADENDGNYFNSKIDVEIYKGQNNVVNDYITTLEKNFYNNECSFDVSPVIATMVEPTRENQAVKFYRMKVNKLGSDGSYDELGIVNAYATYGYLANQSQRYLPMKMRLLSNNTTTDRGGLLYIYDNNIEFSVLCGLSNSFNIYYKFYDNAMNVLSSTTKTTSTLISPKIMDIKYTVPTDLFNESQFIDVTFSGTTPNYINGTLRFQVIKPLKATENFTRIYFRNEYGGLSFVEMTGQHTESDSIDTETYEKNIFDFYESEAFERKKVYSKKVEKTVKLKTHVMEKQGIYIFNSLARSKKVWVVVNGKTHDIIIKNVEVNEDQSYNDLFTATVTYSYSELS